MCFSIFIFKKIINVSVVICKNKISWHLDNAIIHLFLKKCHASNFIHRMICLVSFLENWLTHVSVHPRGSTQFTSNHSVREWKINGRDHPVSEVNKIQIPSLVYGHYWRTQPQGFKFSPHHLL